MQDDIQLGGARFRPLLCVFVVKDWFMNLPVLFCDIISRSFRNPARLAGLPLVLVASSLWCAPVSALQNETVQPQEPQVASASDEAEQAIASFQIPTGWKMELFAAEPDVANGVALFVDFDGTVLVCESFRQEKGIEDNRGHSEWLLDDLAAESVEDRLDYIRKHLGDRAADYMKHDDRIRLLRDNDGDGKVDESKVFANGFNGILDGTGAGVLRYRGDVFYTCIPDLWLLQDKDGDDVADVRKSLQTGYGVRFAFRGHDMHGLIVGPDGRLYFSIGDRGYNVKTDSGHWVDPASGAVFRCELDGSNFEVVATGLRNPQELAFDEFGNLFTGDNNSDSGDQARWVYIAPGGDTGWRMYYQYLADRGPFNREKIWYPYNPAESPAYIIPPITNISDGPSGLAYYPGTGLGEEYDRRFFLVDFRGQASNSGVRTFRSEPKGAFFELVDDEKPIWQILATDIHFGADGQLYLLDWVHGWTGEGKGRIYRLFDQEAQQAPEVGEVYVLLNGGIAESNAEKLSELTAHKDMRVRQEAQFELARRGDVDALLQLALEGVSTADDRYQQLSRLHGIWGCLQMYRQKLQHPEFEITENDVQRIVNSLNILMTDDDDVVQATAIAQSLDVQEGVDPQVLLSGVSDDDPRVAYFAAMAVGNHQVREAAEALLSLLSENADSDPIVRHGGIMGLAGINDSQVFELALGHPSVSVRLAAAVALRKTSNPMIVRLLNDGDPKVVVEAARAIHDLPIAEGMPDLAELLPRAGGDDALARRALNANFRLGSPENANRIAAFAAAGSASVDRRVDALDMLSSWSEPGPLDRVTNQFRPLENRSTEPAIAALKASLPELLASEDAISSKAIEVAAALGIQEVAPILKEVIADNSRSGKSRASSLLSLYKLEQEAVKPLANDSASDDDAQVRAAAVVVLTQIDPAAAASLLEKTITEGEIIERQAALRALGGLAGDAGSDALRIATELYTADQLPEECSLDLIQALENRELTSLLAEVNEHREVGDGEPVAKRFAELLRGGDAEAGKRVFFEKTEVSCVRCHMIDNVGGAVGPALSDVGNKKDRGYLLEAIMEPNRTIAEGFQTVIVLDLDGVTHTGIVKNEDDEVLELMNAEGGIVKINKEDIEARRTGLSSMPPDLKDKLSPNEIRDLVEYLSQRGATSQ